VLLAGVAVAAARHARADEFSLELDDAGIGFDDLRFAPGLGKVLVPGGRTGKLFLVAGGSPVIEIAGFSTAATFEGGHDFGVTSADEGRGVIYATDRTSEKLVVVDPAAGRIVASVRLGGHPDYVRYVDTRHEVWVTEPDAEKIEVFSLVAGAPPAHAADIGVRGGPESLVVDSKRGRAYTHLWKGATVAVDLATRALVATWPNGCTGSRGIELDVERGHLFAGCAEGRAVVLDVVTGKKLGEAPTGAGVDVIAYAPALHHLYVPAAKAGTLSIFGVTAAGTLKPLAGGHGAAGGHCGVADAKGDVFVCAPNRGALVLTVDAAPATK
jgi:DNA-binding beta-propeller fold protein YncE